MAALRDNTHSEDISLKNNTIDPPVPKREAEDALLPLHGFFYRRAAQGAEKQLFHILTNRGQKLIKHARATGKAADWLPDILKPQEVIESLITQFEYKKIREWVFMPVRDYVAAVRQELNSRAMAAIATSEPSTPKTPGSGRKRRTAAVADSEASDSDVTPSTGKNNDKAKSKKRRKTDTTTNQDESEPDFTPPSKAKRRTPTKPKATSTPTKPKAPSTPTNKRKGRKGNNQ